MYKVVPHLLWMGENQRFSWRIVDANKLPGHSGIFPRSAVVAWCDEEAQAIRICAFLNDPMSIEPGALKYWQEVAEVRFNKLNAAESEAKELRDKVEALRRHRNECNATSVKLQDANGRLATLVESLETENAGLKNEHERWQPALDHANKRLAEVQAERDSLRISYEREARERQALEKERAADKNLINYLRRIPVAYQGPTVVFNEENKPETVNGILNRVIGYKKEIERITDVLRDARAERKQAGDDYRAALNKAHKQRDQFAAELDKYKAMAADTAMGIKQGAAPVKQGGNGYADAYCAEAVKGPAATWSADLDPVKAAIGALDRRVTALETKPAYKWAPTVPGSIPAILNAIHDTLYRECPLGVCWSTRKREAFGTHEITITLEGSGT